VLGEAAVAAGDNLGGDALGSDERADRGDGRDAQGRLLPERIRQPNARKSLSAARSSTSLLGSGG
jgi:hypothetical protein